MLGAALALVGCLSPTLPLPPPSPDVSGPNSQGEIEISGYADYAGIEVYAVNLHNGAIGGQLSGDDRHYDFFLTAQAGDQVEVYYVVGNDRSQPFTTVVKP